MVSASQRRREEADDDHATTIAVPTSCAALCTRLAELTQRIDDELVRAGNGAAIDYGPDHRRQRSARRRVADAKSTGGRCETAPTRIGVVTPNYAMKSQY